jgi:hypothetical protein
MCSSAARAAGEPKPPVREKANDKSNKDAEQYTLGGAISNPAASYNGTSPQESPNRKERLKPRLAQTHGGKVKQSRLQPPKVAGFEVTTSGRF